MRSLRLDLVCLEDGNGNIAITWNGVTESDFSWAIDGPALVNLDEINLRLEFPCLQRVIGVIECHCEAHMEFLRRWAYRLQECNDRIHFNWDLLRSI